VAAVVATQEPGCFLAPDVGLRERPNAALSVSTHVAKSCHILRCLTNLGGRFEIAIVAGVFRNSSNWEDRRTRLRFGLAASSYWANDRSPALPGATPLGHIAMRPYDCLRTATVAPKCVSAASANDSTNG
jgi:hypothetical protein